MSDPSSISAAVDVADVQLDFGAPGLTAAGLRASAALSGAQSLSDLALALRPGLTALQPDGYVLARLCGPNHDELAVIDAWEAGAAQTTMRPGGTRWAAGALPGVLTTIAAGETAFVEDADAGAEVRAAAKALVGGAELGAMAFAPLRSQGELQAVIWLYQRSPRVFQAGERRYLSFLAQLTAMALSHIDGQAALTAKIRRLRGLHQLSQSLASLTASDKLLDLAARLLIEETDFINSWLALADRTEGVLRAYAGEGPGVDEKTRSAVTPLADTHQVAVQVLLDDRPMVVPNVLAYARATGWGEVAERANLRTAVYVPLRTAGEAIGVLAVGVTDERVGEDDLSLLMAFGNHLASVIHRMRTEQARTEQFRELQTANGQLERALELVRAMSTPVIPVHDGIVVVPLVGTIDTTRSSQLMMTLLETVQRESAKFVIIDITGVAVVDSYVANHFVQTTRAVALLGSRCVLVGIRPEVAQALVRLGLNLGNITALSDLQAGIAYALSQLRLSIRPLD